MRKSIYRLLHCFLVVGLSLSCAATLAVPKAAEHEDGEVTFGEAVGAPPKPAAKPATQPVSKGSKAAGQPVAKGAGKPTGKKKTGSAKPARGASSSTARTPPPTKPAEKAKPKGKAGKK
jgi:hypothetical protein